MLLFKLTEANLVYKRKSLQSREEWVRVWFPLSPHAADLVVSGMRGGGEGSSGKKML